MTNVGAELYRRDRASDCATGLVCLEQNPYYYQCVAGTTKRRRPQFRPRSSPPPLATPLPLPAPSATEFIKTSGTRFTLNGKQFVPVGSNAYWPILPEYSNAEIDQAFADIAASGATVVRTEGFNEVTSAQGVYFHLWTGSKATVNTGTDGLQRLDYLISSAKSHGIKLLITLTNNWSDFGDIDVYTAQLLGSGQPHDTFYTNPTVVVHLFLFLLNPHSTMQRTYILCWTRGDVQSLCQAVVTRYATEDPIMAHELVYSSSADSEPSSSLQAWKLCNEPRCAGTNTAASATCNSTSLDPNHLVAIGGEGFINDPIPHNFDYPYTYQGGGIGIDFEANLAIDTLDFGTFHLNKSYRPDSWGESGNDIAWGQQWITDHAIMEDFGLTYTGTQRATDYATWQAGSVFNGTETPNDDMPFTPATRCIRFFSSVGGAR
ncbi:glycoside hydrolase superfamily [Mycena galopus ATCC 62051]|nr:glycoside hydrolase superfamily [Mycena galopus ATCC 62051]